MITKRYLPDGGLLVTFSLNDDYGDISVVGNFNDWDPLQHPMNELDGRRVVAVAFPEGTTVHFRYLANGEFFDDATADFYEPNGFGQTHGVLDLSMHEYAPLVAVETVAESHRDSAA